MRITLSLFPLDIQICNFPPKSCKFHHALESYFKAERETINKMEDFQPLLITENFDFRFSKKINLKEPNLTVSKERRLKEKTSVVSWDSDIRHPGQVCP